MKGEDILRMKIKELKKLEVVKKALEKRITQRKAGVILNLTVRQIRRITQRVKEEGDRGIIHRGRGKASNRKIPERTKEKVIRLYEKQYGDFGPTLASEKLEERNGIHLSDETLRLWLIEEGLWEKGGKSRVHRQWRERRGCYGEMVQMDGSHHDWLEGRGPELVLMGYIDDATGRVFGRFYDYEGTMPAMDSFCRYVKSHGIPQSVYFDRHSTYKGTRRLKIEEELSGSKEPLSQFQRALLELGVQPIHAQSPQAKGRIERLFKTFQDRVVKEMRLAKIKTKEGANDFLEGYLPKYNARFTKEARNPTDLHRKIEKSLGLMKVLSYQETRVVRNDNTIQYGGRFYQLELHGHRRLKRVNVQERLDGKLYLMDAMNELKYRLIETPAKVVLDPEVKGYFHMVRIPAKNHPWRIPAVSKKGSAADRFATAGFLRARTSLSAAH